MAITKNPPRILDPANPTKDEYWKTLAWHLEDAAGPRPSLEPHCPYGLPNHHAISRGLTVGKSKSVNEDHMALYGQLCITDKGKWIKKCWRSTPPYRKTRTDIMNSPRILSLKDNRRRFLSGEYNIAELIDEMNTWIPLPPSTPWITNIAPLPSSSQTSSSSHPAESSPPRSSTSVGSSTRVPAVTAIRAARLSSAPYNLKKPKYIVNIIPAYGTPPVPVPTPRTLVNPPVPVAVANTAPLTNQAPASTDTDWTVSYADELDRERAVTVSIERTDGTIVILSLAPRVEHAWGWGGRFVLVDHRAVVENEGIPFGTDFVIKMADGTLRSLKTWNHPIPDDAIVDGNVHLIALQD